MTPGHELRALNFMNNFKLVDDMNDFGLWDQAFRYYE